MSFYYDKVNQTESSPFTFTVNLFNQEFIFKSDNGIFAKQFLDFGTKLLIEEFRLPKPGMILDLGCGYGILGIILSIQYQCEALLIDINERAVSLSLENIKNNSANANALQSDGYQGDMKFAAVVTNPPIRAGKKVVYQFYQDGFSHLEKDGELWVVIRKEQGAASTHKELLRIFKNVTIVKKKKGYCIFKCIKSID